MTRKTRTILFSLCAFLFLVSALVVVFYSYGYRFDFEKKRVTQTGAFYFKVYPRNSQIYLDGKPKKKTDFFFGAAFIENLLPKRYQIRIEKEDFHLWEKSLEIKEKGVTEAKNIVLVPRNPDFTILANEVADFFFSPDEERIILKGIEKDKWVLKLYETEKDVKSHLIGEADISKSGANFLDLKFSPDSKKILLQVSSKENLQNFILDLEKTPPGLIPLDFLGKGVENFSFNPLLPQKIFFTKLTPGKDRNQNSLFATNYITKEISQIPLTDLVIYKVSGGNIFWISNNGFLFRSDLSGRNQERFNLEPFPLKDEVKYQLYIKEPRILLTEGDIFYLFDQDLKSFKKIFEPVRDFRFSPDSKKLVYFNDYEIWILFLEKIYDQPQKEALSQLFLTRFSSNLGEVFWLTSHYLIFNTGEQIKIAEIDDRDRINIVDIAEFENSTQHQNEVSGAELKIFWSEGNKELYILSEGDFYKSERLTR